MFDNGPQFKNRTIEEFCDKHDIRQKFTSVPHPETNGQAKASNKVIVDSLKKRLNDVKGRWVNELHSVL